MADLIAMSHSLMDSGLILRDPLDRAVLDRVVKLEHSRLDTQRITAADHRGSHTSLHSILFICQ